MQLRTSVRYTSQVTYANPTNSEEFVADSGELLCSEPQNICALSKECPCSVRGMSMLYLRNVCALSSISVL